MRRGPIWLYDLGQIFDASEKQEELIRHAPLESVAIVDGAHRRVRCAWLGRCLFTSWMALRGAQETDAECPAEYPAYESECSELRAQSSSLIVCVSQPAPSNASEGPLVSGRARLRAALAPHGRARASHTHSHGLNLYWGLSRGRASSFSVRSPLTCHNVAAKLYAGSSTTCLACFVFRVDISRLPACDIPALRSRSQLRRRRCVCPAVT